jgi:hypothetical protein
LKDQGLIDGYKISDEVMAHLRRGAVHAIHAKSRSLELVAAVFGFSRSSMYQKKRISEGAWNRS